MLGRFFLRPRPVAALGLGIQGVVLPGSGVIQRFEMRKHDYVRQDFVDFSFNLFQEFMAAFDRPVARDQHMHGYEFPCSCVTRAERMKLQPFFFVSTQNVCISVRSECGRAVSIRPETERLTIPSPVQTMFAPTARATTGSRGCRPLIATAPTPTSTPAELHTSVVARPRCAPPAEPAQQKPTQRPSGRCHRIECSSYGSL